MAPATGGAIAFGLRTQTVKAIDPQLRVGGPATSNFNMAPDALKAAQDTCVASRMGISATHPTASAAARLEAGSHSQTPSRIARLGSTCESSRRTSSSIGLIPEVHGCDKTTVHGKYVENFAVR